MKDLIYIASVIMPIQATGSLLATGHIGWALLTAVLGGIALGVRDIYMERKYESAQE